MNVEDLNSARRVLLTESVKSLEKISITTVALKEHILHASLKLYIKVECLQKNLIYQDGVGAKLETHFFLFGLNFLLHRLLAKS